MSELKSIKNALISVFHKDGLEPIVRTLHANGVKIFSTGGTQKFIEELNIPVERVEDLTSYPSILGGRVKTLHPKVFGGILGRRENSSDQEEMTSYKIPEIDLVIVDLYPFEKTVSSGADHADIIEKIDIGGISLIRAGAKNYKDVVIVPSMEDYDILHNILESQNCATNLEQRKYFATRSFHISSHYDTAIFDYFNRDMEVEGYKMSVEKIQGLRYGENPHQKAWFLGNLDELFDQLHGKALSYNNLLDVDAAVNLINEFDQTTFAILKHNNACGLASRPNVKDAYVDALAGDPTSAFGGILITNGTIDEDAAQEINSLFCEVVIAPTFTEEALSILKSKKNRILLKRKETAMPGTILRTALNGYLLQEKDGVTDAKSDLTTVTKKEVTSAQVDDLIFASKICKNTKSNTIVLAKNGQLFASGTGQTSRVDALRQAIDKAQNFGFDLNGAVMASDAFFPFPDCVEIGNNAGITAVIQPGGSIKDQLSIDYCDANDMAMVFTGTRHFKH